MDANSIEKRVLSMHPKDYFLGSILWAQNKFQYVKSCFGNLRANGRLMQNGDQWTAKRFFPTPESAKRLKTCTVTHILTGHSRLNGILYELNLVPTSSTRPPLRNHFFHGGKQPPKGLQPIFPSICILLRISIQCQYLSQRVNAASVS